MSAWNARTALQLCRAVERVVAFHGAHVALTGGCLYKDGIRKDCDLVIYRHRQAAAIDWELIWEGLHTIGLNLVKDHGFCKKCDYNGSAVDILFPEFPGEDDYEGKS